MLPSYADENVKAAVVDGLRRRGMDIVTAQERGQRNVDDELLLQMATDEGRIFLSNDSDLLRIAAGWAKVGRAHAGIVYWKQHLKTGLAIRRLLEFALRTSPTDAADRIRFL